MAKQKYILIIFTLVFPGILVTGQSQEIDAQDREYKIKAAFLYNFIKFVDWPEEKVKNEKGAMVIGIIGKNTFGDAFEPVKDKDVKGQKAEIKHFKSFSEYKYNETELKKIKDDIKNCHLIFICSSEKEYLIDIINIVKDSNVLTVGETKDFLKADGIINFILEENKVRFEINLIASKESKLTIRSQLLRLAKRVIEEKSI